MASWFTRAIDTITPWDRGGEVERRKKREEEQRQNQPRPTSRPPSVQDYSNRFIEVESEDQPKLTVKPPENKIGTLRVDNQLGKLNNTVSVFDTPANKPVEPPKPGTIVKPNPKQPDTRAWGTKLFDTLNPADDGRSWANPGKQEKPNFAQRNLSPTGVFNIGKEILQAGPRNVVELAQSGEQQFRTLKENAEREKRGEPRIGATDLQSKTWQPSGWQKRIFGDMPTQSYQQSAKDIGGFTEEKAGVTPNPAALTGLFLLLNALPGMTTLKRGAKLDGVTRVPDASIADITDVVDVPTPPRPITVTKNIPVDTPIVPDQPVNVRVMTQPKPLIQEVSGDATMSTPDALVRKSVTDAREQAARDANFQGRLTQEQINASEGITPTKPNEPFKLDTKVSSEAQDKLIDEYATSLKSYDDGVKGGQMQKVDDGSYSGTYIRTTEHSKFYSDYYKKNGRPPSKAAWREEAQKQIRNGNADPEVQKMFNEAADPEVQSLLAKGEQPDAPTGKPIQVKESKSIPVRDETVAPQGLPEQPGTVRATTATAPAKAETEAIASQPVTATVPKLPKVGSKLPDGTVVTKRMVQSARNQRKLARQMAKTQEQTAEAMERVNATSAGRQTGEGFAPTGKFKKGKNGNVYEESTNAAESARGQKAIANQSADDLIAEMSEKTSFEQFDVSRIKEMRERLMKDTDYRNRDDFKILDEFYKEAGTERGKGLALYNRVLRRNATGDRLTNQWYNRISKVSDDAPNISDADYDAVVKANDNFTKLRDAEVRLDEQYLKTGSEKDFNAWLDAHKKSVQADIDAKTVEVNTAKKALKGSKNENVAKVLSDLEKEADLNMMDPLTASQLSGPATGIRNLIGTELAGVENRVFANTRAKITNKLFSENVGGYNRKAARMGRKEGFTKFGDDIGRRAVYSGKNPIRHAQNWATSVNSMGEASLYSQADSRLGAYYKNQLKKSGYTGKDLDMRVTHAMAKDPDAMKDTFLDASMKSSGLSGLYQKTQKIEHSLAKSLEGQISKGGYISPKASSTIAKGAVRLALGYPTATMNFVVQSGKRVAMGVPSFVESGAKLAKGDKQAAALAFDRGLKEAGSGAAAIGTGVALSQAGLISGFYPNDPDERQRWTDEGKSELSVKINGAWYPIPTQFGMFGLPLLVGAAMNDTDGSNLVESYTKALNSVFGTRSNLAKLLPTDQAYGVLQVIGGDSTTNQDKSFVASTIRSFIPNGSLLAQTAKGLDQTVNDTTTKDFWANVRDQVISGIPGLNNLADIPDKLSSTGEPLKNPNLAQVYSGARTVEQTAGVENSKKVDAKINESVSKIDKYGLLNDPNMEGVLEGTAQEALVKANAGRQLDESDIKALQEGLVKGVSSEGTDTAYLEREQYDTNLAVLKMKRDLMSVDKTTKPSSLKDIDVAIKRGEIYKKNKTPYQDITDYKSVGVEEWRKMGDPDSDEYDPDMYQKLWDIDQTMTKAGVSYKKGALDKNKYYQKESKSGSRSGGSGSRGKSLSVDFGKLSAKAPKIKEYETLAQTSGTVPVIRRKQPNIVHAIKSGRV